MINSSFTIKGDIKAGRLTEIKKSVILLVICTNNDAPVHKIQN